jgi:hypothetical protein
MAPIATVVAWMPAVIAVAIGTIVAVAISVIWIRISIMRIPISVAIVGMTARTDVDINLCSCVSRRQLQPYR